jgi:hypothetical protein
MSWTSCYAVVGTNQDGFFDPLFPDVCADRKTPYRIAVTVNVAYAVNGNSQTSMLQTAVEDVRNFKAGEQITEPLARFHCCLHPFYGLTIIFIRYFHDPQYIQEKGRSYC